MFLKTALHMLFIHHYIQQYRYGLSARQNVLLATEVDGGAAAILISFMMIIQYISLQISPHGQDKMYAYRLESFGRAPNRCGRPRGLRLYYYGARAGYGGHRRAAP